MRAVRRRLELALATRLNAIGLYTAPEPFQSSETLQKANGAAVNSMGGTSLNFDGFYINGTWYLTGESRAEAYNVGGLNSAAFEQIKILNPVSAGGIGAWEIGARLSELNLNSGGIKGGQEEDVTVGLNWYVELLRCSLPLGAFRPALS